MPRQGRLDGLVRLVAVEGHVPHGEVEAGAPRLDGHDLDEARREEVAVDAVAEAEGLLRRVVLQAAVEESL